MSDMPPRDDEGYLIDPSDWNEGVAGALAERAGIALTDDHWLVIRFMRDYFDERQIAPDARHAMRVLDERFPGEGRARLFALFPYGYVAQACKIAGMRRPRAWSTG